MNNSLYEIKINKKSVHPLLQIWKTAWTFVPFTFITFIHFYLVDVRHFQNYIVVHFLTIFAPPPLA